MVKPLASGDFAYLREHAVRTGNLNQLIDAVVEHGFIEFPTIYMRPETRSALLQAMTKGSLRRARYWAQWARRHKGRR